MRQPSIGAIWFDEPRRGYWSITNALGRPVFPDRIHLGGVLFRKAVIREAKPGVIEQYREAVEDNSRHLLVRSDGTWIIDHSDDVNPDMGDLSAPLRHYVADHPSAPYAILGLAALLVYAAYRSA